ncbi:LCP family glycopolymer transferase [Paenibacillus xanthanilyticus]|uniref:LCP family protein n=1 Tax=Paenibacillus xanthanilyticus TaxID=1783531 RepID=A0ABV8KB49_9BACL
MRTKKTTKRILFGSAIVLGVAAIALAGYAYRVYNSIEETAAIMYEEPAKPLYHSKDPEVRPLAKPAAAETEQPSPFTILVMGVDERKNDRGRSDTIIVLSVNPVKKSTLMFNIPRDTKTAIIGRGTSDKINHAYAFGGIEMSLQTVENFLDYPINYYLKVNMEGFSRIIDLMGGVDVDNPFAFHYQGAEFRQGELHLDGEHALLYSRMRFDDPQGDRGRNARQRQILKDLMKNGASLSSIAKIDELLAAAGDHVKTNLTFGEMKTLLRDYRPSLERLDTEEIKGRGEIAGGIWYFQVNEAERTRLHDALKNHQAG